MLAVGPLGPNIADFLLKTPVLIVFIFPFKPFDNCRKEAVENLYNRYETSTKAKTKITSKIAYPWESENLLMIYQSYYQLITWTQWTQ